MRIVGSKNHRKCHALLAGVLLSFSLVSGCQVDSQGSPSTKVEDSGSSSAPSNPPSISPTGAALTAGQTQQFSAVGGTSPYAYTVTGGGTISASGLYTAPGSPTTAYIYVTDSAGLQAFAVVSVFATLTITPSSTTLAVSNSRTFTAAGGLAPRTFSIVSGGGSIGATTGVFTAPASAGAVTVRVADNAGHTATASITVNAALAISPTTVTVAALGTTSFSATGGVPPYSYSITSGAGSIVSGTGAFTASSTAGASNVRVTDSIGNTSNAALTTVTVAELAAGSAHACARMSNGEVKCWGRNNYGQLGVGDVLSRGDGAGEMGSALQAVNLGTGRTAKRIAAGGETSCAILDNDFVKCWGRNTTGQLGLGDTNGRGDTAGEMGDSLGYALLGTGRTAKALAVAATSVCAISDLNTVKCWGANGSGQLGRGDTTQIGDGPAEMGDDLLTTDLGAGVTANQLVAGSTHYCALTNTSAVKCWGLGSSGQLGKDANTNIGSGGGQMGAALTDIALGATVTNISAGGNLSCAVLNDGSARCWGINTYGQLGREDNLTMGDVPGEMATIAAAQISVGGTVTAMSQGPDTTCAILSTGKVICWGRNNVGQTGMGNTTQLGDATGEMATVAASAGTDLGTSYVANSMVRGQDFACAILSTGIAKCWGGATYGQLGKGNTNRLGDGGGEMGNTLTALSFY